MKRDWDLIRLILLKMEEHDPRSGRLSNESFVEYDSELAGYNILIMADNGLIEIKRSSGDDCHYGAIIERLTWEGQEFLDKIRSQSIWNKTVDLIKNKGSELTFETIKVAAGIVTTSLLK